MTNHEKRESGPTIGEILSVAESLQAAVIEGLQSGVIDPDNPLTFEDLRRVADPELAAEIVRIIKASRQE